MKIVEIVVPCYNEEDCIEVFYHKVCEVFAKLSQYDFIITYVDDGSSDSTLQKIKGVVSAAPSGKVRYISFSRNFGKESAIYAGLSNSCGDYVALMDADLQHPPELLEKMLIAIEKEGYDCASARRISRKGEPVVRSLFSKAFYHVINKITAIDLAPGSTDYRLMKRNVVKAVVAMTERERFTKGIYSWVGFKNKWIEYENVERVAGNTKWSFLGLIQYAYSGFMAFTTAPLRGVIYLGMLIVAFAVIYAIYTFVVALKTPDNRTGYATIVIIMLLLGGVIITILGLIGEYLARIFTEVKQRPIYLVRDTNIADMTELKSFREETDRGNIEKRK
ncbi:MAG: glycosyltransferase family 2 protein [Muribaculaceae bacterium]|nr:glycosyltransferase family 2 protein [Muribaculaceae bacterium]